MAGIIGADNRFGRDFNRPDADMQGNITALYDIGCVVGSIVCYFVGEHFGRRTMLIAGGSIMIVGAAILASSTTIAQLIVGRMVTGLGNGMNSSTAPVYLTECAPPSYRGALLTLHGTVTILGVVIAYWLVPFLNNTKTESNVISGWTMAPASLNPPFNGGCRSPFKPSSLSSLSFK